MPFRRPRTCANTPRTASRCSVVSCWPPSRCIAKEFHEPEHHRLGFQQKGWTVRAIRGLDLRKSGWYSDGANGNGHRREILAYMPGILRDASGELRFAEWGCRAGQNNVINRTDGTV